MHVRLKTRLETKKRHSGMRCRVIEIKIDRSHLSKQDSKHMARLFDEARWFYNHCVEGASDLNAVDCKATTVQVKTPDGFEGRDLIALSSQMRQGIKDRMWTNLKSLSTQKKQGTKVGWIRFTSVLDSVPLKQFGFTFNVYPETNRIRLQSLKKRLRVSGLEQIKPGSEVGNAHLVRRDGDYFLKVTTFEPRPNVRPPNEIIGIDLGCETPVTLSNGVKVQYAVPVSKRTRKLDHIVARKRRDLPKKSKKTKKRLKAERARRKSLAREANKRRDIRDKIVHALVAKHAFVAFQTESVHWMQASGHGKKIAQTGIGGIISDLRSRSETPLEVERFYASSQTCSRCGARQKMPQDVRVYDCPHCGLSLDRDINAAKNMLAEGLKQIPAERRDPMPREGEASSVAGMLSLIPGVHAKLSPANGEAVAFRRR